MECNGMKMLAPVVLSILSVWFAQEVTAQSQVPTWKMVDSVWSRAFLDIACADSLNCLAISQWGEAESQIRRSSDGGRTWRQVYLDTWNVKANPAYYTPFLTSVAYPGIHCAVVSREAGQLLVSYDDCKTWERRQLLSDSEYINKVCMIDESVGYAVGDRGPLFRTTDGWRTWSAVDFSSYVDSMAVVDLECISENDVKIMTQRASKIVLASTSDGGATFKTSTMPTGASAISFVDRDHGWFAGSLGTGVGHESRDFIGVTTDGGATWTTQLNDTITPRFGLKNIVFYDSLCGLAAGRFGKILRTIDGGKTWRRDTIELDPNSLLHVNAIAFVTRNRAVAAISNGEIVLWEGPAATVASSQGKVEHERISIQPCVVYGDELRLRCAIQHRGPVVVQVLSVDGREVFAGTVEGVQGEEVNYRIPVSGLGSGMYFVQVQQGDHVATGRFIVQR